jgi:hypothetical protein
MPHAIPGGDPAGPTSLKKLAGRAGRYRLFRAARVQIGQPVCGVRPLAGRGNEGGAALDCFAEHWRQGRLTPAAFFPHALPLRNQTFTAGALASRCRDGASTRGGAGIAPSSEARKKAAKSRIISRKYASSTVGETMHKIFAMAAIAAAIMAVPAAADAQERMGDAALGAISGAVVAGPFGAVAGGLVGWTAGPSIARSWGLHRHSHDRDERARANHREANRNDHR